MAVAHDAQTRFPATDTTGLDVTAGDRTFSHAGSASATAAVVVVCADATAAAVTGVLYGGVAMTLVGSVTDTTEAGQVRIFALTSGVPTGTQTVTLQGCTTANKFAVCSTVTSGGAAVAVIDNNGANTTTSANPTFNLTTSVDTMIYGAVHGGEAAPASYVSGTGYTRQFLADYGTRSAAAQRSTTVKAPGTVAFNFADATSDDWCIAAVAIGLAASGTNWTQPVNDTVSLADAQTPSRGIGLAIDDTAGLGDSLGSTATFDRAVPETVTLVEAIAYARGLTLTEAVALADQVAAGLVFTVTVNDTLTLAEALAFARGLTVAETVALADQLAQDQGRTLADTLTLADALAFDLVKTLTETVGLADNVTPSLGAGATDWAQPVADTLTLADAITLAGAYVRQVDDTVSLADALTAAIGRVVQVADTVTLADVFARAATYVRQVDDTVQVADASSSSATFARAFADTMTVTDLILFDLIGASYRLPAGRPVTAGGRSDVTPSRSRTDATGSRGRTDTVSAGSRSDADVTVSGRTNAES